MKALFRRCRVPEIAFFRGVTFAVLCCALAAGGCTDTTRLPDPLEAGWQGEPVCQLVDEDRRLRILRCTFEPGKGHERHFHAPHFGYAIIGGRMRITDETGTREVDVSSGSIFRSEGIAWHEVLNIGETTAVFLILEPK